MPEELRLRWPQRTKTTTPMVHTSSIATCFKTPVMANALSQKFSRDPLSVSGAFAYKLLVHVATVNAAMSSTGIKMTKTPIRMNEMMEFNSPSSIAQRSIDQVQAHRLTSTLLCPSTSTRSTRSLLKPSLGMGPFGSVIGSKSRRTPMQGVQSPTTRRMTNTADRARVIGRAYSRSSTRPPLSALTEGRLGKTRAKEERVEKTQKMAKYMKPMSKEPRASKLRLESRVRTRYHMKM
mmetsp:Transcript_9176/g.20291  ORF Transcript_9176/g.20291 Transcript_9176/m.20291 type:complete len:236 (+) Transcript_9176:214-921(+)